MAVAPLYNDLTVLKQRIRMNDSSDTETLTVIDQVIRDVRINFYSRLTAARALEIAALTTSDNPETDDEILRAAAETAEVYWVQYKLICILPVMTIETQFAIRNNFDDVPLTRDSEGLLHFRGCLWNSIERLLGQLAIPEVTNTGDFKSSSIGAAVPVILNQQFIGLPRG